MRRASCMRAMARSRCSRARARWWRAGGAGATEIAICERGNPGMATAGMGDVLTGVIAGLRAQCGDSAAAARIGVLVHALAGDSAAQGGQRGLIAERRHRRIARLGESVTAEWAARVAHAQRRGNRSARRAPVRHAAGDVARPAGWCSCAASSGRASRRSRAACCARSACTGPSRARATRCSRPTNCRRSTRSIWICTG